MSTILTIDRGNTATKIKVFEDERMLYAHTSRHPDIDLLADIAGRYNVGVGALCSVGHIDARLIESLRLLFNGAFLVLTPDTDTPVTVNYGSPRTLGADRVAAVCGAISLYPTTPLLVADAGTALTLDYVNSKGTFMGGNISAGITMKLQALHKFTASLPEVSATGPVPPLGTDTCTALRSGAIRGTVAEIVYALSHIRTIEPDARLIVTGGDASLLSPFLPSDTLFSPDLISTGLISILKYNEYI